jgi:anaerobic magnesium-protoporphyrin IX monomethyl ester cyclase
MSKKVILVARYYSIEPLGILYLAGTAKLAGWDCRVVLIHEFDFQPLYDAIREWEPDLVGFQIWTGYHLQAFKACDTVREMGVKVVIGGPHATYSHAECEHHAEWVVKGEGFRIFHNLLSGVIDKQGTLFDMDWAEGNFPLPDRDVVYNVYPEIAHSPIKSIFGSVGCPFTCTYCYAPAKNVMYNGFKLSVRPVDEIVAEAKDILARWPLKMIYFQDDIFGYNIRWLEEFAKKWSVEVGVPFHCQIRLELTRHAAGDKRLDLFVQAGCSGITLAIESGNEFLRDQVLFRHMPDHLILEGCKKILDRGMTLRTEQILAVPFSDLETDLSTLDLNNRINPTMAWTSILAPYAGTDMGTITANYGFYGGNNDDLAESFFDRSVLRHMEGGPRHIQALAEKIETGTRDRILLSTRIEPVTEQVVNVIHDKLGLLGTLSYLSPEANDQYCSDTVRLQRLFNWIAKVPNAAKLGAKLVAVPPSEWSWECVGEITEDHLWASGYGPELGTWRQALAIEMGEPSFGTLPKVIRTNPWFFVFFPAGGSLAQKVVDDGIFEDSSFDTALDRLGTIARRHLFHFGLYKIDVGEEPIARMHS